MAKSQIENMELVKVQVPLFGTTNWLVYDAARKRMQEIPESKIPRYVRKVMRGKLKEYLYADWKVLPTPHWELSPFMGCEEDFK